MKYNIHRNLHDDFSIIFENKMDERSYFIPFSSSKKLSKSNYKNERFVSDRINMLSGEWDFAYYDKLSKVPEPLNSDSVYFEKVTVPSTWQRTGYDQIAYINARYAFPKKPPSIPHDVAVGVYRKSVDIDDASVRKVITFLGVAGALALYINGKYVGYSEGSHNPAEFEITDFLSNGKNEILAVVYKWSNGTYLECQDMFRENGIFRDVYITEYANSYISDFIFRSSKNADGTYDLNITVDGEFAENTKIKINSSNEQGTLFAAELNDSKSAKISSINVNEWSAEIPNIYETVISVVENDKEIETIRTYLGFKDIKIDGEVFKFNGKNIKIKGVNHHDTHMTNGYVMSIADLEKDVTLMKEYNCNAVRTSHYPPDPAFLIMCDIYGLYVIDEADIETHGFFSDPAQFEPGKLSNDPEWISHYLDRVKRMYGRDKNHPSIIMWSLGNESGGFVCQDACYDYLKSVNPEMPVHYEGAVHSKRWAYDVVSKMYDTPNHMRKIKARKAGNKYIGKPYFQCEYAHAMGNGPGGLEEYMQLFYSSKQFLGGCIWEWADHAVYNENAKYKWTYGGDHNEPIHDGNFCVDGLFYPNREPSSGALEMKVVYRPVRAKYLSENKIELWNTQNFASTEKINIKWDVVVNGIVVDSDKINPIIEPQDKAIISIESDFFKSNDSEIFVNLTYLNKDTDFEIAKEQLEIITVKPLCEFKKATKSAKVVKNGNEINITFNKGSAKFNVLKGLVSYKIDGKEYLNQNPIDNGFGFVPHIFRGKLDNDRNLAVFWMIIGLNDVVEKLTFCDIIHKNKKSIIRTKYSFVTRKYFVLANATVDYCFENDGSIYIDASLSKCCPLTDQLPRFGVHIELDSEFENVKYYGRGPEENYSDFCEHAPVGIYETTVSKMAHKYIKPQDSGNREDVRYAVLTNKSGEGIKITAQSKYLSFNANHFTLGQLNKVSHIEDLPDVNTTFTAIDGFVRGTGSNSCGPAPSKQHLISFGYLKPLGYAFKVEPIK